MVFNEVEMECISYDGMTYSEYSFLKGKIIIMLKEIHVINSLYS